MKKNKITETRISGTIPGDIMISGDAETLSLSDLKPETVKQVAAELLEQEKAKTRSNEKLALLGMRYGRARINPYATPIFDLKSFGKPIPSLEEAAAKWREVNSMIIGFGKALLADRVVVAEMHDEIVTESVTDFAKRWGRMLLAARPQAYPETGPELIEDKDGNTREIPELKIETNQQWSPEELKNWLKAQLGNTQQDRKPYSHPDLVRPYRTPVVGATSNDGVNWVDNLGGADVYKNSLLSPYTEFKDNVKEALRFADYASAIRNPDVTDAFKVKAKFAYPTDYQLKIYTSDNWPLDAPPYDSPEGWEYQKTMTQRNLKSMLTASWFEKQQTEKHALVAKRLREILAA